MACIGRLYSTEEDALKAVQALSEAGFEPGAMLHVSPDPDGEAVSPGELREMASARGGLGGTLAIIYSRALQAGRHLVLVNAQFGFGQDAESALESANPVDPGGTESASDRAASPFSDLLGMPVLSDRGLSIFSRLFPSLTRSDFYLFGGRLRNNPTPFSNMIRLKPLTTKPMGDSSMGMPLLKRTKRPWTSSFGIPLLTRRRQE
jgi:hypothetical protein